MIISHRCQFVVFPDPLISCDWLQTALGPWADQPVSPSGHPDQKTPFFNGMTPEEAEKAFAQIGAKFADYTRIAIVQNPFRRMAAIYDRLVESDPLWRLKARAGWKKPDFATWLQQEKPDHHPIWDRLSPRWRRLGSYSAEKWAAGRIDAFVRSEYAGSDMRAVLRNLGVVPIIDFDRLQKTHRFAEMLRYDHQTLALVQARYASDLRLYSELTTKLDLVA